jgi:DNA-binding response OmpR family regulator
MHVLIADDDPGCLATFAAMLRQEHHAVATAETFEAAVLMVPYVDVVLADGLNGSGLVLCSIAAGHGKRAVLCSGDPDYCEEARARGYGALEKPASIVAIVAAVCGAAQYDARQEVTL